MSGYGVQCPAMVLMCDVLLLRQVNVPERKIILSERAAMLGDLLEALSAGDVVEGVVTRLTDFGAFVSLLGTDGKMHGTEVRGNRPTFLPFTPTHAILPSAAADCVL